jgi:hypothetical protein
MLDAREPRQEARLLAPLKERPGDDALVSLTRSDLVLQLVLVRSIVLDREM